jgi:hypothetical protein
MRRVILPWVVLFALILVAAAWDSLRLWPFNDRITQATCDRLVPGTSRGDVWAIMGSPGWTPPCGVGIPPGEDPEFWEGRDGTIHVTFDYDGYVIRAEYYQRTVVDRSPPPDYFRRLRKWLGISCLARAMPRARLGN